MRSFVMGLLAGAIVAAIATTIAITLLEDPGHKLAGPSNVATTAVVESAHPAETDPAEVARHLEGADDRALAEALDSAEFDRSWARVNGVGRALRARANAKVDPLTGLVESAVIGPRAKLVPLLALELEVARRKIVLELRGRDNAAVRLLDHASEDDAVSKLVDLFTAEAKRPDYEPIRTDAALVLAFGATDRGREVLARAVREGPPDRGAIAARALGLSEDEKAFEKLTDLLARDLDPEVRKRAADGLASTSALARASGDVVLVLSKAARSDTDEGVRIRAFAALGGADLLRGAQARAVLCDVITSPSEPQVVRAQAIAMVRSNRESAQSTPPDVVDALLGALATERDGPLRVAIADALAEVAPPTAVQTLETAYRGAIDPDVRDALGRALVAVKGRGEPPP
jgi:HEAT repeat protein